jgi:hypothetical protein
VALRDCLEPAGDGSKASSGLSITSRTRICPSETRVTLLRSASDLPFGRLEVNPLTGRLDGSYGTTWSFPLLHNGCFRSCRVTQGKLKKSLYDSLFKHDLTRPTLTFLGAMSRWDDF